MEDGARLRAYSWRSLYSFGVSEMRRASRVIGWIVGAEDGSEGAPVAAPVGGMMEIWRERWMGDVMCIDQRWGKLMELRRGGQARLGWSIKPRLHLILPLLGTYTIGIYFTS